MLLLLRVHEGSTGTGRALHMLDNEHVAPGTHRSLNLPTGPTSQISKTRYKNNKN